MTALHLLVGAFCIFTAWLPAPPNTWFGESLFGVKLIPWPIMNGINYGAGAINIYIAYSIWSAV